MVTGDFGVSLAAPDAFVVRHTQGVFDANAEALWWTGEGLNNTGEAFAESREWVTLASPDADIARLHLPPDARSRIAQDLASGLIVAAPTQPVPRGPDQFVGWWRIDPTTGATEGIAGNGWGQCGAEYASLEGIVVRAMWRGLWEYVLCQGINQAINDFRRTGAELQAKGIWFWWVGPIQSASPEDVFWASNKGCLIGAIQAGFVSTLPFLIARYNLATQPWLMSRATWLDRFMRDQRGGARIPPRLARGRLPGLVRAQAPGRSRSFPPRSAGEGAPVRSTRWQRRTRAGIPPIRLHLLPARIPGAGLPHLPGGIPAERPSWERPRISARRNPGCRGPACRRRSCARKARIRSHTARPKTTGCGRKMRALPDSTQVIGGDR